MNKILRIVGYAVLVIVLVVSSILFIEVSKGHKAISAMQEKVDEAEKLYNSNQEDIDKNLDKAHQKMEEYKYYVRSSVLPLYADSRPMNPVGKLNANDEVYVDGTTQNGMVHIFAEADGKKGEYYTFPGMIGAETEELPAKVVVVSINGESDVAEASRVIKAFSDLMETTGSCALVSANEETAGLDWNTLAKDCGADAHIVVSAVVKGEDDKFVCSVTADDVINSKALGQELNRILGDNSLTKPTITEEGAEDESAEGESTEITEGEGAEDESIDTEPDAKPDQDMVASCMITVKTVKPQIEDNPESVGTDETLETENADTQEEAEEPDYTAQIINCIKVGLENYLSKL